MADRHSYFLRDWHSNERAILARVAGNWIVYCGHCGVSLGGCGRAIPGPDVTLITWRHDGDSWFGTFEVQG